MKRMYCEMCGGSDLIKQDGVFVCESCGCKYSVEEARKMMVEIEGTVDVSGSTIKVDNSAFVEKYLANARRAKEKEDWEETEKYYNLVEQNDPDNIEAIFYSAYGKAKSTLVDADIYKRQAAFKVLKNCISIIDDHYKPERRKENKEAISSMGIDLGKMILSNFVYNRRTDGYGFSTDDRGQTYALFAGLLEGFKESMDNIQKVDDQPYLHESLIALFQAALRVDWTILETRNILYKYIKEEEKELEELNKKIGESYWSDHLEEKAELDSECYTLEQKVEQMTNQLENMEEFQKLQTLERNISVWEMEEQAAILKKKKEKIHEQIATGRTMVEQLCSVVDPIRQPLEEAKTRLEEVKKLLYYGRTEE